MLTGFWALILAASACVLLQGCDTVRVADAGGDVGLLVDGQGAPDPVNDFRLSKTGIGNVTFRVGNLTSATAPNRNEVICFGTDRAPVREPTPWTSNDDAFSLRLNPSIPISLTFWIIESPFDVQDFRISNALLGMAAMWADERTGLVIGDVDIVDATSDPDITNAIRNSVGGDDRNWDDFSDHIGFHAGRINVYWINTVEGNMSMGWSDFGPRIVIGQLGNDDLLMHEIGHALDLIHVAEGPNFQSTNAMIAASVSRRYFTEGQVFRMHFNPGSGVNDIYNARPGEPQAACMSGSETPECPRLRRRVWADGPLPPN